MNKKMMFQKNLFEERFDVINTEGVEPHFIEIIKLLNIEDKEFIFSDDVFSAEMTYNISGFPMVDVELNGESYKFWLDTGAGVSVISELITEKFDMHKVGTITGQSSTGQTSDMAYTVVPEMQIGNMTAKNFGCVILPKEQSVIPISETEELIINGAIGLDLIKKMDLTLNFIDHTYTVKRPTVEDCKSNMHYDNFLLVEGEIAGKKLCLVSIQVEI